MKFEDFSGDTIDTYLERPERNLLETVISDSAANADRIGTDTYKVPKDLRYPKAPAQKN